MIQRAGGHDLWAAWFRFSGAWGMDRTNNHHVHVGVWQSFSLRTSAFLPLPFWTRALCTPSSSALAGDDVGAHERRLATPCRLAPWPPMFAMQPVSGAVASPGADRPLSPPEVSLIRGPPPGSKPAPLGGPKARARLGPALLGSVGSPWTNLTDIGANRADLGQTRATPGRIGAEPSST